MFDRRTLVLASAALVGPLTAWPQTAGRPYRVGLVPDFAPTWQGLLKILTETLAEVGRAEGRDYVYIRSGVFYGADTQQALGRVMDSGPDLIFATALGSAVAAHKLTKTIPIVMWSSGFPVEGGVAESLARPGKNVTGMTVYAGGEVFGKLVQLVHEAKPGVKRIGALMSYTPPLHPRVETDLISRGLRDGARPLGVEMRIYEIAKPEQVDDALAAVAREDVDALVLTAGSPLFPRLKDILRFAADRRLPTIIDAPVESLGDPQPLLGYWATFELLIRHAAQYVDRILWHAAKPGDLPIQLPARFGFRVNLRTARTIGITVPQSMVLRADQVIQ